MLYTVKIADALNCTEPRYSQECDSWFAASKTKQYVAKYKAKISAISVIFMQLWYIRFDVALAVVCFTAAFTVLADEPTKSATRISEWVQGLSDGYPAQEPASPAM